jgi:hypothetical protein
VLNFKTKYSVLLSKLVLAGYLLLITANTFHYHSLNLFDNITQNIIAKDDGSKQNPIFNKDFQCPIHHAYQSIHNSFLVIQHFDSEFKQKSDLFKNSYKAQTPSENHFINYNLRAPPQSSKS